MKIRVVTNNTFESFIEATSMKRRKVNENRFDSLDIDDITTTIEAPSESEVDQSIRELDFVDAVATATGTEPDISDSGVRFLDLDDGKEVTPKQMNDRIRALDFDFDEEPKRNDKGEVEDPAWNLDLDFDETKKDVQTRKSNFGSAQFQVDMDDVDYSSVVATIDDVYNGLASDDPKVVASIIRKYANDITDNDRITEAMLIHASKLNLKALEVMCGNMSEVVPAQEQAMGFVDEADIKSVVKRFKRISSKLNGNNNTYGLIPNAIVSCTYDNQIDCMNVIDFLITERSLPVYPIYFRGAVVKKCYDLANFLLEELNNDGTSLSEDLLFGKNGLIKRIDGYTDVPKDLVNQIVKSTNVKSLSAKNISDLVVLCCSNDCESSTKSIFDSLSDAKSDLVLDFIEDKSPSVYKQVEKYKRD